MTTTTTKRGRSPGDLSTSPARRMIFLAPHERGNASEHRNFLQEYIDSAQGGMFQALAKEKKALQLWREAEFEKEIHGKTLTAAQLSRAELPSGLEQKSRLALENAVSNGRRGILPPSSPVVEGSDRAARRPATKKSAKPKKTCLQGYAVTRRAGSKNIWGQTAWS